MVTGPATYICEDCVEDIILKMLTESSDEISSPFREKQKTAYCSFCGKAHTEVNRLIVRNDNHSICNECIVLCLDVVIKEQKPLSKPIYL